MSDRRIFRSARLIGGATLLSRILGLVRDVLCAAIFGAGWIWDAFALAFLVPNLFRRLFGEGALSAAVIPLFTERNEQEGVDAARDFLGRVVGVFGLVLLLCVGVGWLFNGLVPLPGLDLEPQKFELVRTLLFILIPYLFFICLTAMLGGVLNAVKHFALPAFLPVILNIVWIATIWFGVRGVVDNPSENPAGIQRIAWAILVVSALQLVATVQLLRRKGFAFRPRVEAKHRDVKDVTRLFLPTVVGLAIFQLNVLADNLIAEWFVPGEGAVSYLYYGARLMQFPLALIGISIATAAFPDFSRHGARQEMSELGSLLARSMRACLLVGIPASVGLFLVAEPLVNLLFAYKNFDAGDAARTARVLRFYAIGVWALSVNHVLTRGFYALKDTRTPVRIGAWMLVLNVGLNLFLVRHMQEAGLALSTAAVGILNMTLLYTVLKKKIGAVPGREVLTTLTKTTLAGAAMGAGVWAWLAYGAPSMELGNGVFGRFVLVGGAVGIGAVVYTLAGRYVLKLDRSLLRF